MSLKTKFFIAVFSVTALVLIVFAAAPPPGTYIVPSFFTTNAAKIYGTNGVGVSSNATLGIYLIDGSGISGGDQVWTNDAGSIYPIAYPLWNNLTKRTVGFGNGVLSGGTPTDDDNTAIGFNALNAIAFGGDNTALGSRTLEALTNGNHNVAVGNYSLQTLKFGHNNIGIGESALHGYTNLGNGWNLAIGNSAAATVKNGIQNVVIGHQSDGLDRGASDMTLVGFDAQGNTNDTVIGSQAGQNLGVGGNNVLIGKFADMGGSFNHSNSFAIGSRATITANNQGVFGKGVSNYVFRDVEMTFPAANANGIWTNDGAGKLGWFPISSLGIPPLMTNSLLWSGPTNGSVSAQILTVESNLTISTVNNTNRQLNTAQPITTTATPAFAGLNSPGTINANILSVTNSVFFWYFNNAPGDFALVSDGNNVTESGVTSTELNYVSGVTSPLQNQLDSKQQKFSVASNNTVIVSSGSVTQFDFYAFTSLTQANGKVSIGAPSGSGSSGISVQSNAFGGTVGSGTNLLFLTDTNHSLNATNTTAAGGTNTVEIRSAQGLTTTASPTFQNIGVSTDASVSNHLAIGQNNTATNRIAPFKTRFFALTNASGGWGDWMAGTPMPVRRNWFWICPNGGGIGTLGAQSAASIGSAVNAEGSTNEWPAFSYATGATSLGSNGIIAATSATQLSMHPGKNLYFCFVGRVSQMVTQRWWCGYTSLSSANLGADTDTPTSSHCAMIRQSMLASGNLTNWALVTCDGSACTATSAGGASLTTTNIHVFEMMEDRPNTRWLAWVDGICIATNTANLPASGMHYAVMISTKEGVAKTFRGNAIYGEMDDRIDGNIVLSYP